MRPHHLDRLREAAHRFELVIAACNRTAAYLSTDIAGAVDRDAAEELLDLGVYHRQQVVVEREVYSAMRMESPPARWPGLTVAVNLFFFARGLASDGTGSALLRSLTLLGPVAIARVGFDGADDPRTRWQGTAGYKDRPALPAVLRARAAADETVLRAAGYASPEGAGEALRGVRGLIAEAAPREDREGAASALGVLGAYVGIAAARLEARARA